MSEPRYQLTQEEEQMLAELHESKFFAVLIRLAEVLDGTSIVSLKNNKASDQELRYWQGYGDGAAATPLTIEVIAKSKKKVDSAGS